MKDNWIPEKLYREIQKSIPILCVDVVVECGGGVLLMKRKNYPAKNKFWIPGGRLRLGEDLKKFAVEKVREETGLVSEKSYSGQQDSEIRLMSKSISTPLQRWLLLSLLFQHFY